jgi:hypothetical protein
MRRVALTFMWALVLLLIGLIDAGIFSSVRHSSHTGFVVLVVIDVVLTVAVCVYFAVRMVRRWNVPSLPGQARTVFRVGKGRSGAVLSGFLQLAYLGAGLVLAVVFLFFPALFVAMFLMSLMPQPLMERQARLSMAEQLRGRGIPAG